MKFEIVKELLFKRLADLNSIIERKTTQPILGHVYIKAENDQLTLISTDTEVTLRGNARATVLESGKTTVPCDKFYQIVHRLPNGVNISCELIDEQFHIRASGSHFKLVTLPGEDFPVAQSVEHQASLSLDATALYNILNKVRFSIANQDVRQYLNGLFINVIEDGEALHSVATDGHRLSCAYTRLDQAVDSKSHFIIPEKAVNELVKHLSLDSFMNERQLDKQLSHDVEEVNRINDELDQIKELRKRSVKEQMNTLPHPVTVYIGERELSLQTQHYHLISRLIDGQYPEYEKVIPQSQKTPVLVDREVLLHALRRAKVLLIDRHDGIRLRFEGHTLFLSARNMENETAEETLDIVNTAAILLETGLNINYLIDAVSNIDGENLQIHFENAESPCLITSIDDPGVHYVIMPMRL